VPLNIIHRDHLSVRWAGHAEPMREMRNAYNILVGKPEGERPLGKSRRRWERILGMYLAQNRDKGWVLVKTVMSLRLP
jgi:hypothetical protein